MRLKASVFFHACLRAGAAVALVFLQSYSTSAAATQGTTPPPVETTFSPVGVWLNGSDDTIYILGSNGSALVSGTVGRYTVSGLTVRLEFPPADGSVAQTDWNYDIRRDVLVYAGTVNLLPEYRTMRRRPAPAPGESAAASRLADFLLNGVPAQPARGVQTGVTATRQVEQAMDITGSWVSYKGNAIRAIFQPNWADGSSLLLPGFQDPNPPEVAAFVFRGDGTYSYAVGRGNVEYSSQSGTYRVARTPGNAVYPYQVTLTPDPSTVRVNSQGGRPTGHMGLEKLERGPHRFWVKADRDGGFDFLDADARDLIGFFWLRPAPK